MKKSFTKVIAILLALSVMLTCGVPVFANITHTQTGYGAQGATDNGYAVWSLNVNSSFASSNGGLINGYTGTVYCRVGINNDATLQAAVGNNSASKVLNGDGSSALVEFSNITPPPVPVTDGCDQRIGAGSRSGSTSQVTWAIEAAPSFASSSGSIFSGYYGMVYCAVSVDGNWYESDVANSNSLSRLGSDTYAEIWIR